MLWNDLPTRSETVISHSRHFRNVFLTSLLNQPLKKLSEPPFRPHLVFFHERKPVVTRGRQITAFHTHLHMGALPDLLNHLWYLDHLITRRSLQGSRNSSRPLLRVKGSGDQTMELGTPCVLQPEGLLLLQTPPGS